MLKPTSKEYYQNFSTRIADFFTTDSMVKLIVLYKKAEFDKKHSDDRRSPSPYYLLNFLGYYLKEYCRGVSQQDFLKKITIDELIIVYNGFKNLSSKYSEAYQKKYNLEYNMMIKQKIDIGIMDAE